MTSRSCVTHLQGDHITVLAKQQLQQCGRGLLQQLAQIAARSMALKHPLRSVQLIKGRLVCCSLEALRDGGLQ